MNMEQQRKAFDEWYSHKYSKAVSEANKEMAWQGWLAAQKQEGYVMVPVEPTEKQKDVVYENLHYYEGEELLIEIYKSMVQAAQE